MKIKITVKYPDHFPQENDYTIINIDNINDSELSQICFDYALDMIFNSGIAWSFERME